ncbi:hypothetical protein GQ54DRAFT_311092 [Martensiomyces pterosporus]|nr:hypothetical protein GQ54DRAFT_311092 [Martensiomyces pterosporus]
MYCKRCGDIVYSERCKRCGGRPVESTTGAAAASGERKDPWSSTYLERRFHPSSGGGGTSSRPLSTVYSTTAIVDSHADFGEPPMYKASESPSGGSPNMRAGSASGSPVLPGGHGRRDSFTNIRHRQIRDSPASRPMSMYVSGGTGGSPGQSPVQRAVASQSGNRQFKSPALSAVSATQSSISHIRPLSSAAGHSAVAVAAAASSKAASPSAGPKPRWSQYFTSTASPQVNIASGRTRSETVPSPYTRTDDLASAHGVRRSADTPRQNSVFVAASTAAAVAAAAAGVEAASLAHTQLADQHTRRISSGYRTGESPRMPANLSHSPADRGHNVHGPTRSYTAGQQPLGGYSSSADSRSIAQHSSHHDISAAEIATSRRFGSPVYTMKTPALPSPIKSVPAPQQTSPAFDARRPSTSNRMTTTATAGSSAAGASCADSAMDGSVAGLRARSATLPDLLGGPAEMRSCTTCGKLLRPEEQRQFASKQGIVYCTDCYHSSYSRGFCAGCQKIVLTHGRPWVQYGEKVWHKLCIKCCSCNKLLITPLVDLDGMPTCEPCFLKSDPHGTPRYMPKDPVPPTQPLSSVSDLKPSSSSSSFIQSAAQDSYSAGLTAGSRLPYASSSKAGIQPRSVIEPPIPSAIGGSTAPTGAAARRVPSIPVDPAPRADAHYMPRQQQLRGGGSGSKQPSATATAAASIPTPIITEYDRAPSSTSRLDDPVDIASVTGHFNDMALAAGSGSRIMSPVEVAEKEGLPPPRAIVDPDISAISRSESQATAVEARKQSPLSPIPAPRPTPSPRSASPQYRPASSSGAGSSKIDVIKSQLKSSMAPAEPAPVPRSPLSPSLKSPNSPAVRTASPRTVSFLVDQHEAAQSHHPPHGYSDESSSSHHDDSSGDDDYEHEEQDTNESSGTLHDETSGAVCASPTSYANEQDQCDEEQTTDADSSGERKLHEPEPARSLADYVLSKASGRKSKATLPSVADTIKKFSAGAFAKGPGSDGTSKRGPIPTRQPTIDKSQLPELKDLIRTHQRQPPTDPTIPALDKHSRILKSRPRNSNKRRPSQTPSAMKDNVLPSNSIRSQHSGGDSRHHQQQQQQEQQGQPDASEVDAGSFVPNQCARCSNPIEDTWFRLSDGRQVHVECFTCQGCGNLIDDGVYVLENGIEYHPPCVPPTPPIVAVSPAPSSHSASSRVPTPGRPRGPRAPRQEEACDRCHVVLSGPRFHLSNGKRYHPDCFACAGCGQRFDEGSYVCFEGQEYHHQCVGQFASGNGDGGESDESQLVCSECSQVIEGVFVRHNDCAFHPNCFSCYDCRKVVTPGMPFGEIDGHPCCESCLGNRTANAHQQHQQQGWAGNRQHYPAHSGY